MSEKNALSRLIVLIATALLAGICGALAVYLYLLPLVSTPAAVEPAPILKVVESKSAPRLPAVTLPIVSKKSLKPVPGGLAAGESDVLGSATVLTSDGWLVSDRAIFSAVPDPVVILPSGAVESATSTVIDSATGLIFFKVAAKNLDVVTFGESARLRPAANLFLAFGSRQISSVDLVSAHFRPVAEAKEVIRPDDVPAGRLLFTSGVFREAAGGGVISENGALVGIALAPRKGEAEIRQAVPIEAVSQTLKDILRRGAPHRPTIGVSTVDLSELAARQADLARAFGALVTAVEPGGQASQAGIAVSDRITALGDDSLDGSRLFSDLLSGYAIGESVNISFTRGSEQKTAEVVIADAFLKKK